MINAIEYLHKYNIMHRDLKPENILIMQNFLLKIADFGLATYETDQEIMLKWCGSPGFVAPEILSYKIGQPMYNKKCDIFSLGIIFFIL